MARQQLIVDTKTPKSCVGAVGTPYIVSYTPSGGGGWAKKGDNINGEAAGDYSGWSVSLSSDGNVMAIGAPYGHTTHSNAGCVRVYAWNGTAWEKRGGDIYGEASSDYSGVSVSLSSDGSIVAIGAHRNDGGITTTTRIGHVRVYQYDATKTTAETSQSSPDFGPVKWRRLGADIDGEAAQDVSGYSVSLSSDGSIVAIGAYAYSLSNAGRVRVYEYKTITEDEYDEGNTANTTGAVGVPIIIDGGVSWGASTKFWVQQGDDIDGEASNDLSGYSVSLNDNGRTVTIGAPYADSNGLTSNGDVRVYRIGSTISPQVGDWAVAEHKETNTGADLSTYTYRVTQVTDADTLVLKFVSATTPEGVPAIGWGDIDTGSSDGVSLDVSSEQNQLKGIAFSSDGLKLSIIGGQHPVTIHQYDLTVAWDLSSASYNGDSMSVTSEDGVPEDLTFSSDGLKMYIVGLTSDKIHQYDLTVAWDVTSASYKGGFSFASKDDHTQGVTFKTDGTSVYICGQSDNVHQYDLTVAWDVTGGNTYIGAMSTSSEMTAGGYALEFSPDGTKLYVADGFSEKIHQYNLTVAWDVTSGSYSGKNISTSSVAGGPQGLRFSSDGTKFYTGGFYYDTIYQFSFDNFIDDSPCDLCDGTGPPGDCPIAPHVIKRDLGGMFMMLLD